MNPTSDLQLLYKRLGYPALANFSLTDLDDSVTYRFGAFVVADCEKGVVLIRRKPGKDCPGIENYWWVPGGGREDNEELDETAKRELQEETGLRCTIQHTLFAQRAEERSFIAVFFRGIVTGGELSSTNDPDCAISEVKFFPRKTVPFEKLCTDADRILLVQEGFACGEISELTGKMADRTGL